MENNYPTWNKQRPSCIEQKTHDDYSNEQNIQENYLKEQASIPGWIKDIAG